MRLLISALMIGQLLGCMRDGHGREDSGKPYRPFPQVEVSIFSSQDRIASVYVRHSRGGVLFRLSPQNGDDACGVRACGLKTIVTLYSPVAITFCPSRYENFDRSFDMFADGTVVMVPLAEDGTAAGVFVNLLSGKSYFFIPSLAKVDRLAKLRHGIKLVTPEDVRSAKALARFPEFER